MRRAALLVFLIWSANLALAQEPHAPMTNTEVIEMTKSGISEHTIVLAIEQGPVKFDTSPQVLIELKKSGVTDQVLNAMLAASSDKGDLPSKAASSEKGMALLQKALNAVGPREKLVSVRTTRWTATVVQSSSAGMTSSDVERVTIYPDRVYMSMQTSTGLVYKLVFTADFSYAVSGKMTSAVPAATLEAYRSQMKFDPPYVAQHLNEYTLSSEGTEQLGNVTVDKLRVGIAGAEHLWKIDSQTGRLLSVTSRTASGESVIEYSDFRLIDGTYCPFKRHTTEPGRTTDVTIKQFEVNPLIDDTVFQRPNEISTSGFTLRVLQATSVPYTEQIGGGISTSCQISGSANTSMTANTIGSTTIGNATTNSNLRMNCNSYDTTVRWPHVLNAMLVEASDGNAYIIACDRAWRWSKCVPLRAGDVFNARHTEKGIEVQSFNTKGKEAEPTYRVLQSRSLR